MRDIDVSKITEAVKEMCIEANHHLSTDMQERLINASEEEISPLGRQVLGKLKENLEISAADMIPICQDTGMAVVFMEIGQDVHLINGDITDAVNEGVRRGYTEGFLRKSIVSDPLIRKNTGDNTPAVLHFTIVPGDQVKIIVAPKGFGSENKSHLFMLTPADGVEGVRKAVLQTVREAGPNACPPMVIGVGIGGNFEKCACLAKQALLVPTDSHSELPHIKKLEEELLTEINMMGIGPAGLGGCVTALALHILTYPTHIAGLPCAVNICCHVNRHVTRIL